MKLNVVFAVATADGSTYLAISENDYYVKGCYSSESMKFDNIEALHKQIDADAQFARQLFMI